MKNLIEKSQINYHLPNNAKAREALDALCKSIVEMCVECINEADETMAITTYDKDLVLGTKLKCIEEVYARASK